MKLLFYKMIRTEVSALIKWHGSSIIVPSTSLRAVDWKTARTEAVPPPWMRRKLHCRGTLRKEGGALKIAVTGTGGLIGRSLATLLAAQGHSVVEIDISAVTPIDITDPVALSGALADCDGVLHLAAISRVAEAQKHPFTTWAVNVDGTRNVLSAVLASRLNPWLIHASSREVYGSQPAEPIGEDTPITPLNVYGRSKAACESLAQCAIDAGANISILRFANVYGDIDDHSSRVIPAFTKAAELGSTLRVDDAGTCMDFTHVIDVCDGIVRVVDILSNGEKGIPPIHFATGEGTRLGTLAQLAVNASNGRCIVNEVERRASCVGCFIGNPQRAKQLLDWGHKTALISGSSAMVKGFAQRAKNHTVTS